MTKRGSHAKRDPRRGDERRYLIRLAVTIDSYLRLVLALPPCGLRAAYPIKYCDVITYLQAVAAQEGQPAGAEEAPSPCSSCTEVADPNYLEEGAWN